MMADKPSLVETIPGVVYDRQRIIGLR